MHDSHTKPLLIVLFPSANQTLSLLLATAAQVTSPVCRGLLGSCRDLPLDLAPQGILVTAYSPLGSPKDAALSENKRGNMPILLHDKVVQGIADKHGKHPAQVHSWLTFALRQGCCYRGMPCSA